MHFDKIIMNPPYSKNLHLKILQEAIKHSNDIVNLSPIRWLQDPLAEYKKNSDWKKFEDVREKIESLDVVENKKMLKTENIEQYRKDNAGKYAGKYNLKKKVQMYLKRHNNEFNPKWNEEEKNIAEELLSK